MKIDVPRFTAVRGWDWVLGVDSGAQGGLCAREVHADTVIGCFPNPFKRFDGIDRPILKPGFYDWFRNILEECEKIPPLVCLIEEPQTRGVFPGKSGTNSPKSIGTTWWMAGCLFEFLRLQELYIQIQYVHPKTWQSAVLTPIWDTLAAGASLRTSDQIGVRAARTHDEWKSAAVEYVRSRYPGLDLTPGLLRKPHDGIADAVCIAEYASRLARGEIEINPPKRKRKKRGK